MSIILLIFCEVIWLVFRSGDVPKALKYLDQAIAIGTSLLMQEIADLMSKFLAEGSPRNYHAKGTTFATYDRKSLDGIQALITAANKHV